VLQVDGYGGYKVLAERSEVRLAFCWSHVRRPFYELAQSGPAPIASEALARISALYRIEGDIRGRSAEERHAIRQERTRPLVEALQPWLREKLSLISQKTKLAEAIRYALSRWVGLCLFLEDGRVEIDNNAVERAIRPLAMRRSLYPPFSSIWEHWKLVFRIDAIRATCSPDRDDDPLILEVGGADLVRRAGDDLVGGEDSVLDEPADVMVRNAERRCGFRHRYPFAVLFSGTVGMDPAHPAHRADAVCGPGFSLTGGHSHPVQRRRDVLIRPAARHAAHNGEGLFGGAAAMLAGLRLADPQLRMLAAAPMDRQDDLARRLVDVGNDVGDKGAQEPLTRAHGHARRVPCGVEIVGKAGEVGRRGGRIRRPHFLQSRLARLDAA